MKICSLSRLYQIECNSFTAHVQATAPMCAEQAKPWTYEKEVKGPQLLNSDGADRLIHQRGMSLDTGTLFTASCKDIFSSRKTLRSNNSSPTLHSTELYSSAADKQRKRICQCWIQKHLWRTWNKAYHNCAFSIESKLKIRKKLAEITGPKEPDSY